MNKSFLLMALFSAAIICFSSCKSDSNSLFEGNTILIDLQKEYETTPNPTTANALLRELMQAVNTTEMSKEKRQSYLEFGYDIAKKENMKSREAGFLFPLVKGSLGSEGHEDRLFELANLMQGLNKPTAANTIYKGIMDNYPKFEKMDEVRTNMTVQIDTINSYITDLGKKIFEDADNTGINRKASLAFVDACEAYALAYPNDPKAPENLFKAAEVAKSIRTFPKSLSIYDWILESYPDYEKASTSLFLKGFIIENSLGDDDKAREVYNEFLKKYPQHDLADDVEFLIENLGKSDEEILKMIESKRKENSSK